MNQKRYWYHNDIKMISKGEHVKIKYAQNMNIDKHRMNIGDGE